MICEGDTVRVAKLCCETYEYGISTEFEVKRIRMTMFYCPHCVLDKLQTRAEDQRGQWWPLDRLEKK